MRSHLAFAVGILLSFAVAPSMAQNGPGGAPGGPAGPGGPGGGAGGFGGGGGRGFGGGFDPAQIRTRMSAQLKESIGATDEEWQVLQPKVEKIQSLQSELGQGALGVMRNMFRGGGRGFGAFGGARAAGGPGGAAPGGGGPGAPGGAPGAGGPPAIDMTAIFGPDGDLQKKMTALTALINAPSPSQSDIKVMLQAIREEREKVAAQLKDARKDLIDLLTPRQEAILFQQGLLE